MRGSQCKVCGKRFHWCPSCGWDRDMHALSQGYCSDECLIADAGMTYDDVCDDDDDDDEAKAQAAAERLDSVMP